MRSFVSRCKWIFNDNDCRLCFRLFPVFWMPKSIHSIHLDWKWTKTICEWQHSHKHTHTRTPTVKTEFRSTFRRIYSMSWFFFVKCTHKAVHAAPIKWVLLISIVHGTFSLYFWFPHLYVFSRFHVPFASLIYWCWFELRPLYFYPSIVYHENALCTHRLLFSVLPFCLSFTSRSFSLSVGNCRWVHLHTHTHTHVLGLFLDKQRVGRVNVIKVIPFISVFSFNIRCACVFVCVWFEKNNELCLHL